MVSKRGRWNRWCGAWAATVCASAAAHGCGRPDSDPKTAKEIAAESSTGARVPTRGIEQPVTILLTEHGVAHVVADDEVHAAFGLGYVHARERLWQMDFLRRMAQGRLAEILGPDLIETDSFVRRVGLSRAASAEVELLDSRERSYFDAYAAGVNAWTLEHTADLPPEFGVLGYEPEPWAVADSLAIVKGMSFNLSVWDYERYHLQLAHAMGAKVFDLPLAFPSWAPTTLDDEPLSAALPVPPSTGAVPPIAPSMLARLAIPEPPRLLAHAGLRASNAWVVSGSRTASGKPMVANDMHLDLQAPSLWFLAAQHWSSVDVGGVTIPGLPFVVAGRNRNVAWGLTAANIDDLDFAALELEPNDGARYRGPDGWLPLRTLHETIAVRGQAAVDLPVRISHHGPIITEPTDPPLAMMWSALAPERNVTAFLGLNRATGADSIREALSSLRSPALNVLYADVHGTIGYQLAAAIPVRVGGDGQLPFGAEGGWRGVTPFEQLPHATNPARGFFASANNPPTRPGAKLAWRWPLPFRAMRIEQRLSEPGRVTAEQMAAIQVDETDLSFRRYQSMLVDCAREAGLDEQAKHLASWDGEVGEDSVAAPVYLAWLSLMKDALFRDQLGDLTAPIPEFAFTAVLDGAGQAWVDDVTTPATETLRSLCTNAMKRAVAATAQRTWGDLHRTTMAHPLAAAPDVARALGFEPPLLRTGGSPNTLNATSIESIEKPFASKFGASERQVVDLGAADARGRFVLPTGQSGRIGSPHYTDQMALWTKGELLDMSLERASIAATATERFTLTPQP